MKMSADSLASRGFAPVAPAPAAPRAPAPIINVEAPIINVAAPIVPPPRIVVSPIGGPEMEALAEAIRAMKPGQRPSGMSMTVKRDMQGLISSAHFTFEYN